MIDFTAIRPVFGGSLKQTQVDGLNFIDSAWRKYGDGDVRKYAYVLATAAHETGMSMEPVTENLTYSSASRIMAVWPSRFPNLASAQPFVKKAQALANKVYGGRMGNDTNNDGWTYRGRGYAQITGKELYARVGKLIGEDLVTTPDLAKRPEYAAKILVVGLMKGLFTGKKLSDYINDTMGVDYVNARRCVNADVAANGKKIANLAQSFFPAISKDKHVEPKPPEAPIIVAEPDYAPAKKSSPWLSLVVLGAIGAAILWFVLTQVRF